MNRNTRKKEWFDDDAFWRATYTFLFPEKRFAIADETVRKILSLTGVQGNSALDLCCGPGRCSIALARLGFSVTGVDRTAYLLKQARARAKAANLSVEWVQSDMRDFVRPQHYNLAISMFTSFGYFDNRNEDMAVLRNVCKSLQPDGVFLVDLMGKEVVAKSFQPSTAETLPDGSTLVERREIVDDWTRIRTEWIVVRNGRAQRCKFQLNLYSGQELREKLEGSGLTRVKLYGNLDGDPYGPGAGRLIAIGRKPKR